MDQPLAALDSTDDTEDLDLKILSLASTGPASTLIKLPGLLNGLPCLFLIDSGSTGNFVADAFTQRHRLQMQPRANKQRIALADGSSVWCSNQLPCGRLQIGSFSEELDLDVTALDHCDAILGKPWLAKHNPEIDWTTNKVFVSTPGNPRYDLSAPEISQLGPAVPLAADASAPQLSPKMPLAVVTSVPKSSLDPENQPLVAATSVPQSSQPLVAVASAPEPDTQPPSPAEDPRILELSAQQVKKLASSNPESLFLVIIEPDYSDAAATLATLSADSSPPAPADGWTKKLLEEYRDVFPDDLPPGLPPQRAVDHRIELLPGSRQSAGRSSACRPASWTC